MERFKISRVLVRSSRIVVRNAAVLFPLAALFMTPVLIVNLYSAAHGTTSLATVPPQPSLSNIASNLESAAKFLSLLTLCDYFLQASLAATMRADTTDLTFGESLVAAFRNTVPIIAISILSALGILLGLMLFLVPGIILTLAWTVVIPVKLTEHTTIIESFRRSMSLTKGYRWQILALWLMYFLLLIALETLVDFAVGIPFISHSFNSSPPILIWGWAERVATGALFAVVVVSTYAELRVVKDGFGAQRPT